MKAPRAAICGPSIAPSLPSHYHRRSGVHLVLVMPRTGNQPPEEKRANRFKQKYVELEPGRFVANFDGDYDIREVDLESRNPDVLKEFPTKEAAVAFEEECFQKKEKGELEKRLLHRIPKDMLTIQEHQKPPKPTADIVDEHHEPVDSGQWTMVRTKFVLHVDRLLIIRRYLS